MSHALAGILQLLVLKEAGHRTYLGPQPDDGRERQRVFGGQVAAQAVMAAARTAPDRLLHSLHVSFLRAGHPKMVLRYEVTALRDGRTFSTRRVSAVQGDTVIMEALISFIDRIDTFDVQAPMPDVPAPESLPDATTQLAAHDPEFSALVRLRPFDMRYVDPPPRIAVDHGPAVPAVCRLWLRVNGEPPAELLADPLLSTCLLVFVSDWTILDPVQVAIGQTWQQLEIMASLDHAMWFHRPVDFSDWLLYDQRSAGAVGGRGLGCGSIYNRSGALVCTIAQEGYLGRRE